MACGDVSRCGLYCTMTVSPVDQRIEKGNGKNSLFFIGLTALSAPVKTTLGCFDIVVVVVFYR